MLILVKKMLLPNTPAPRAFTSVANKTSSLMNKATKKVQNIQIFELT